VKPNRIINMVVCAVRDHYIVSRTDDINTGEQIELSGYLGDRELN